MTRLWNFTDDNAPEWRDQVGADWRNHISSGHGSYFNRVRFSTGVDSYARDLETGDVVFRRRKRRKFRTRYVVYRVGEYRQLDLTNAEIRWRKSKKVWSIYLVNPAAATHWLSEGDEKEVARYRTLKAAKLALKPGVLDRMGAEVDRCTEPTSSAPSSTSEASNH